MSNPAVTPGRTSALLRWSLGFDAYCEILWGGICLIAAESLAEEFGLKSPEIFRATGAGLIGVGMGLGWLASRKKIDRSAAGLVAAANGLSGAALLSLAGLKKRLPVTPTGQAIARIIGIDLAILALLEYWGLRRGHTKKTDL